MYIDVSTILHFCENRPCTCLLIRRMTTSTVRLYNEGAYWWWTVRHRERVIESRNILWHSSHHDSVQGIATVRYRRNIWNTLNSVSCVLTLKHCSITLGLFAGQQINGRTMNYTVKSCIQVQTCKKNSGLTIIATFVVSTLHHANFAECNLKI